MADGVRAWGSQARRGPITMLAELEEITSAWLHWYSNFRLMHRLAGAHRPRPKPDYL